MFEKMHGIVINASGAVGALGLDMEPKRVIAEIKITTRLDAEG